MPFSWAPRQGTLTNFFSFLSLVPPLSSPTVLLPDNVTHSGSPRPQKHPYRAPAKEAWGPFSSARFHLVKSTRFKRLVNIQFLVQVWTEPIVAGESVPSVSCFRMLAFIRKFLREVSCYCLASVDDDCCVIVRCVEHAQHKVLRKKNKHAQTKHLFVPISVMWEDWNWRIVCLMFYRNVSQKKKRLFKEFSDL